MLERFKPFVLRVYLQGHRLHYYVGAFVALSVLDLKFYYCGT